MTSERSVMVMVQLGRAKKMDAADHAQESPSSLTAQNLQKLQYKLKQRLPETTHICPKDSPHDIEQDWDYIIQRRIRSGSPDIQLHHHHQSNVTILKNSHNPQEWVYRSSPPSRPLEQPTSVTDFKADLLDFSASSSD